MKTEEVLSEIDKLLEGQQPDAVVACDLLLRLASYSRKLEVQPPDNGHLRLTWDGNARVFALPRAIGWFRSLLARVGALFFNSQRAPGRSETANKSGHDEDHAWTRSTTKLISATFAPTPGSPLYTVEGTLVLEAQDATISRIHVAMENSGRHQWLVMTRESSELNAPTIAPTVPTSL
jgi:hypothetical protein